MVIKNKLILKISGTERIIFSALKSPETLSLLDTMLVTFHDKKKIYVLYRETADDALYSFCAQMQLALSNKLFFDQRNNRDIGLIFNDLLNSGDASQDWPTDDFELWSPPGIQPKIQTWLYNNENGEIIFHATEMYFWFSARKTEGENYKTYKEFVKSYEPILIRKIDHDVARKWLADVESLLGIIVANDGGRS